MIIPIEQQQFLVNGLTLDVGETFTIEGYYARRTFRQWLMRHPRELQVFVITDDVSASMPGIHQMKFESDDARVR